MRTFAIISYLLAIAIGIVVVGTKRNSDAKYMRMVNLAIDHLQKVRQSRPLRTEEIVELARLGNERIDRSLEILLGVIFCLTVPVFVVTVLNERNRGTIRSEPKQIAHRNNG